MPPKKSDLNISNEYIEHLGRVNREMEQLVDNTKGFKDLISEINKKELDILRSLKAINKESSKTQKSAEKTAKSVSTEATLQEQIVKLLNDQKKALKDKTTVINSNTQSTKQETDEIKEQNTELDKQEKKRIALAEVTKTTLKYIKNVGKSWLDAEGAISKLNAQFGSSQEQIDSYKNTVFTAARSTTALYNVTAKELSEIQSSFTDAVGRNIRITESGFQKFAALSKIVGKEGVVELMSNTERLGMSTQSTYSLMEKATKDAQKNGLNLSKVIKDIGKNTEYIGSVTFKDGIIGLQRMTIEANKFRINMSEIASLASKVSSPEGAIQTAAKLQVLGGSFAAIADPLQMLHEGINDIEALSKRVVASTADSMSFDRKTGVIDYRGGYERMRGMAGAEALGINHNEFKTIAQATVKRREIERGGLNKSLSEEMRSVVASVAEFNTDKGKWEVNLKGNAVAIDKLTEQDKKFLVAEGKELSTIAQSSMGVEEAVMGIKHFLENRLFEGIQAISTNRGLRGLISSGANFAAENPYTAAAIGFGGMGAMHFAGRGLGRGASNWLKTGKFFGEKQTSIKSVLKSHPKGKGLTDSFFTKNPELHKIVGTSRGSAAEAKLLKYSGAKVKPSATSTMQRNTGGVGKNTLKTVGSLGKFGGIAGAVGITALAHGLQGNFGAGSGMRGEAFGETIGAGIGTALGTFAGPLGMMIGGFAGTMIGGVVGRSIDNSTKKVKASVSKLEALNNFNAAIESNDEVFAIQQIAKSVYVIEGILKREYGDFINKGEKKKLEKAGVDTTKIGGDPFRTYTTISDGFMMKNGNVVKVDDNDTMFAAKPNGGLSNIIPKALGVEPTQILANSSGGYKSSSNSGPANVNINFGGTIRLEGRDGSGINIENELLKNPMFIKELTKKIGNEYLRIENGGRTGGNMSRNSIGTW